ncbi:hypothetical protein Hypma_008553 [Hypsizygus marmoreus]|uniref:DUF6533 domain-containing protein n=1 Tax=Hypsizygus marmoreus TaxID=39966 RepID=A0A369JZY3_HYPMA|nr:hypothetical protein Hypma_008553 [Hypsizygus marmoreus]
MTSTTLQLLDLQLVRGTLIASGTVLVYDLLCTVDQEITYVWSNVLSIPSLLFLLNRYLPFVDTFLSLYLKFSRNTPEECLARYTVVTWLIVIGTFLSEIILMLRTYAIWECRRPVLVILCALALIVSISVIVITSLEVKSLKYIPTPPETLGCRIGHASSIIIVAYVTLVVSETTLAVLTGIQAYRHLRFSQSRWVTRLYKNGVVFYGYLLCISIANIVVPITAPSIFANWLATPQRVIHSILTNRVLFVILRQRGARASLGDRLPLRRGAGTYTTEPEPVFTSFLDDGEGEETTGFSIVATGTGTRTEGSIT